MHDETAYGERRDKQDKKVPSELFFWVFENKGGQSGQKLKC